MDSDIPHKSGDQENKDTSGFFPHPHHDNAEIRCLYMPNIAENVYEAQVTNIYIAPGSLVERGDRVIEIQTEKAALDVESPFTGVVVSVKVNTGDAVAGGSEILCVEIMSAKEIALRRRAAPPKTTVGVPLNFSMVHLSPGDRIRNYLILEKALPGGMGEVYKAKAKDTGLIVAIKVIRPDLISNDDIRKRFIEEASITDILEHPSIVKTITLDIYRGNYCLIMEWIEGTSLRDVLRNEGSLEVVRALQITLAIGEALVATHEHNIAHRDIKPENIMILPEDQIKLLDFGAAKVIRSGEGRNTLIGTPVYMSPEQASGRKWPVSTRTDVFSLGVVLYEMLTGEVPFHRETLAETLESIQYDPLPSVIGRRPDVPDSVERLLHSMTIKNPDERHYKATTVVKSLHSILGQI